MKIQITNSAGTFTIDGENTNQEELEVLVEEMHGVRIMTINDLELGPVVLRKELLVNSAWRLIPLTWMRKRQETADVPQLKNRLTEDEASYIYSQGWVDCIETMFEAFWGEVV